MPKDDMIHSLLTISKREKICINGVSSVASFDESFVTLETSGGKINIEGEGMKIESLNRQGGEIEITGRIDGVFYQKEAKTKSFFKGIFG